MSSDRSRLDVVARLTAEVRLQQVAYDRFHDAVAAYLGVNRTDLRCIDLVDLRGGSMSAGDLAASTGLSTGAVTAMLDRLEKAGYLRRVRDPDDRRRILVELGDAARERGREIYQPFADATLPMLESFTDEQIALVAEFLRRGNEFYATQTARVETMRHDRRHSVR
jgi:DNA-binding MarR family transcriptional regulator